MSGNKDSEERYQRALDVALDEMDILGHLEMVMAPLKATPAMIENGCRASGLTVMEVRLVYETMIRTSVPGFADWTKL